MNETKLPFFPHLKKMFFFLHRSCRIWRLVNWQSNFIENGLKSQLEIGKKVRKHLTGYKAQKTTSKEFRPIMNYIVVHYLRLCCSFQASKTSCLSFAKRNEMHFCFLQIVCARAKYFLKANFN